MYAVNISDFTKFFNWMKRMLIITGNKYKTKDVKDALNISKKSKDAVEDFEYNNCEKQKSDNIKANYKNSKFYLKANRIFFKYY